MNIVSITVEGPQAMVRAAMMYGMFSYVLSGFSNSNNNTSTRRGKFGNFQEQPVLDF
jgi:hypothetical protein